MRGLLCIEPLYHKIIAGEKTQTRRSGGLEVINENPDAYTIFNGGVYLLSEENAIENLKAFCEGEKPKYGTAIAFLLFIGNGHGMTNPIEVKPWYKVGEVLYLKEPWLTETLKHNGKKLKDYYYKFDHDLNDAAKFNNKLFMPQAAARAFIKITAIRCERLLDISDEDAIAEGIECIKDVELPYNLKYNGFVLSDKDVSRNKKLFFHLYQCANKIKSSSDISNIWCWVYEFTYLKDYRP